MPLKPCCLVSLPNETGCSGIIIDGKNGFILSHAALLLPYFNQNTTLWTQLKDNAILPWHHIKEAKVNVMLQQEESKQNVALVKFMTAIVNVVSPSVASATTQLEAKVLYAWKVSKFEKILSSLFPHTDKWSFHENTTSTSLDAEAEKMAVILPWFVLLKVNKPLQCEAPNYVFSTHVNKGNCVNVIGTPFGTLSPPVFLNSTSAGIICNKSGEDDCLMLTDARCIPGCEGGGMYSTQHNRGLVGMVVAPLCWKANEWVGYTITCSIQTILESIDTVTSSLHHLPTAQSGIEHTQRSNKLQSERIVLVQAPLAWGTGLLFDAVRGLILTCGHVVKEHKHVDVHVRLPSGEQQWCQARILKAVANQQAFDISVLQLLNWDEEQAHTFSAFKLADNIEEGSVVSMLGYGVFGIEHALQPTITRGVIAKKTFLQGRMVMIQTTCAVHAGASGGPIVADDGSFLAIVTCNAKDTANGALYPHINFSVPLTTIWPLLQQFIDTNDVCVLDELYVNHHTVQKLWRLELKDSVDDATCPISKL